MSTVNAHGLTFNHTASFSDKLGVKITMNETRKLVSVAKGSSSNPTTCYLEDSSKNVITSAEFSGDTATFSPQPTLTDGVTYYIRTSSGASAYTYCDVNTASYPFSCTDLDYIASWNGGADSTAGMFAVQSITTDVIATGMQINIGDAWKSVAAVQINIGDAWKAVAGMQINIGDVWKTIS